MIHSKKRYIVVFHAVTEEGEEQKFVKILTEISSTQVRAKLNAEFINVKIHSLKMHGRRRYRRRIDMKKKSLTNLSSQSETENKKVRNAKTHIYNGIKFRSGLEVFCYKLLVENNIETVYESKHLVILNKFECGYESYEAPGNGSGKILSPAPKTIRQITYNPDFMSKNGDVIGEEFIIECKGYKNDAFPNKLKLIKKYLTDTKYKGTYYMPRNQKQVRQVVELILQKRQTNGTKSGKAPTVWADNMPSM